MLTVVLSSLSVTPFSPRRSSVTPSWTFAAPAWGVCPPPRIASFGPLPLGWPRRSGLSVLIRVATSSALVGRAMTAGTSSFSNAE